MKEDRTFGFRKWRMLVLSGRGNWILGNVLPDFPSFTRFLETARHLYGRTNDFRKPQTICTIVQASRGNRLAHFPSYKCFAETFWDLNDRTDTLRKPRGVCTIVHAPRGFRKSFVRPYKCFAGTVLSCSHGYPTQMNHVLLAEVQGHAHGFFVARSLETTILRLPA